MKRTGLFFGSFNPIHIGHMVIAGAMLSHSDMDEVWFVVSPHNPLKEQKALLAERQRLEMVRLAVGDDPRMRACDAEFYLPRPSYTWNTLRALTADYPDRQFVLMIGGDNWQQFCRWYRADDILRHYRLVVYPRRDCPVGPVPAGVQVVEAELMDISSTDIRRRIRQGRPITGLVPASIEHDIVAAFGLQPTTTSPDA